MSGSCKRTCCDEGVRRFGPDQMDFSCYCLGGLGWLEMLERVSLFVKYFVGKDSLVCSVAFFPEFF